MPPEWIRPVLAHQGGWDEFLLVATPVAALTGLLVWANKRATELAAERQRAELAEESEAEDPTDDG